MDGMKGGHVHVCEVIHGGSIATGRTTQIRRCTWRPGKEKDAGGMPRLATSWRAKGLTRAPKLARALDLKEAWYSIPAAGQMLGLKTMLSTAGWGAARGTGMSSRGACWWCRSARCAVWARTRVTCVPTHHLGHTRVAGGRVQATENCLHMCGVCVSWRMAVRT